VEDIFDIVSITPPTAFSPETILVFKEPFNCISTARKFFYLNMFQMGTYRIVSHLICSMPWVYYIVL